MKSSAPALRNFLISFFCFFRDQNEKWDKRTNKITNQSNSPVLPVVFCIHMQDYQADFFLREILDEISNGTDGKRHYVNLKRRNQPLDKCRFSSERPNNNIVSSGVFKPFPFLVSGFFILTYQNKCVSGKWFLFMQKVQ